MNSFLQKDIIYSRAYINMVCACKKNEIFLYKLLVSTQLTYIKLSQQRISFFSLPIQVWFYFYL